MEVKKQMSVKAEAREQEKKIVEIENKQYTEACQGQKDLIEKIKK